MADDTYNLEFKIDDNVASVLKNLDRMGKQLDEVQGQMKGISDVTGKDIVKGIQAMDGTMADFYDIVKKASKESAFGHQFKKSSKDLQKMTGEMDKLRKIQGEYHDAVADQNKALAKEKKKAYEEQFGLIAKEQKAMIDSAKKQSEEIKKVFVDDKKEVRKVLQEKVPRDMGRGIGNAIQSALAGDVAGLIGGLTQGAGSLAQAGAGAARQKAAERRKRAELSGKDLKGGKMGGLTRVLAGLGRFLGPLAMAVGGLGMVVKLLMDAEAQTKELNKALFEQVSYYSLATGSLTDAENKMASMRNLSTDFATNMRLGLEPKQHYEIIAALNEHNADLQALEQEYGNFESMATGVIETIRIASLNLGTDMNSVSQFVAQMRDIHGESMGQIQEDLTLVQDLSRQSGISTKQFFGIISQISGSMGLYNYKLEETASLLTQMNKIMDSKSAEEFTTQMTQGLKEQNGQERLKTIILANQVKVRKMLRETTKDMFADTYAQIAESTDGVSKLNQVLGSLGVEGVNSASELQDRIKQLRKEGKYTQFMYLTNERLGENVGRSLSMAGKMAADVEKGGLRLVDALGNLGAMDSMEVQIEMLENVFGDIKDVPLILAESMGINESQLKAMQRFSEYSDGQTQILMSQYKAFKDGQISEADFEAFAKTMGIAAVIDDQTKELKNEKTGQLIEDQYDVTRAMSEEMRDNAKKSAKEQKSAAERQVEATKTVAEVLQLLIYDALNQISNVAQDIYHWIAKRFGGQTEAEKQEMDARKNIRDLETRIREKRSAKIGMKDAGAIAAADREILEMEKQLKLAQATTYSSKGKTGPATSFESYVKGGGTMDQAQFETFRGNLKDKLRVQNWKQFRETGKGIDLKEAFESGIAEKLLEERDAEIRNDEEVRKILSDGNMTQEQKLQEINRVLAEKGININTDAAKKFTMAMVKANQISAIQSSLGTAFGAGTSTIANALYESGGQLSAQEAATLLNPTAPMGTATLNPTQAAALKAAKAGMGTAQTIPGANDAMVMSRGVIPMQFAQGDLVIREDSIGRAMRGGPGAFLGKLGNNAGSSGSGNVYNFNVYTTGASAQDVHRAVTRAYEDIKRKEQSG